MTAGDVTGHITGIEERMGGEQYVIGVDFGTLSGRALVVRVGDGAEVGTAVTEYPHGVIERELPGGGELPPDWALQVPDDYVAVLRQAVPAAVRAAGVDPADVIGIGTDFTACTILPVFADGTPLCEVLEYAGPPARLREAVEAPRRPAAGGPDQRARGRAGGELAAPLRRADLLRVGVREGAAAARGGSRALPPDGPLGRGGGLDRLAADRELRPQRLHRRLQGDLPGRALPERGSSWPRSTRTSPTSPSASWRTGSASSASPPGRCPPQAAAWTGLPEGIAVAVGNVDAHVTAPAARAVEPGQMLAIMGTSTCHVMNAEVLAEVPGMCGVVDGGIVRGLYGYEAGQSGVGDIFAWFAENFVPDGLPAAGGERPGGRSTST